MPTKIEKEIEKLCEGFFWDNQTDEEVRHSLRILDNYIFCNLLLKNITSFQASELRRKVRENL